MTKPQTDQLLNCRSIEQISQQPHILTLFLDILCAQEIKPYTFRVIIVSFEIQKESFDPLIF